jgi:uncharacterized membrane protein YqjE
MPSDPTLLGIAAIISAIGGVVSTIWALRKSRREEHDKLMKEYREELQKAREEAEALAKELHERKMREFDET